MQNNFGFVKLEFVTQEISKTSKVLSSIQLFIGLPIITFYMKLYLDFSFFIGDSIDISIKIIPFFFLIILPLALYVVRILYIFKLANSFTELSKLFYYDPAFQRNRIKSVSKFIRLGMISEIITIVISPILFVIIFFVSVFLSSIIFFLPNIFFLIGFLGISKTFDQLKEINLYTGKFRNWLLYSQITFIITSMLSMYGGVKMWTSILIWGLSGEEVLDDSFLIWFLIAGILVSLGYVLNTVGFFKLGTEMRKIHISNENSDFAKSRINTINPQKVENQPSEPLIVKNNIQVKTSKSKYCPKCGAINDYDAVFCANCGASFE